MAGAHHSTPGKNVAVKGKYCLQVKTCLEDKIVP